MQVSKSMALAAAVLLVAGQASAMDVAAVQAGAVKGSVVVERAGHMTPLASNSVLTAGDRVISMDGGDAKIKFADGCSISVHANTVATVGAQSPCAASGLSKTASPMDFGDNGTLLWGFLAVALVAYGVFEANQTDGTPLSP